MIRYYICGLGYDENNFITDYEQYLGDFDTYEEAYEEFVMLQCRDVAWFFGGTPNIYQLLLQLEECEEDDYEVNCIDVKNEWWIINPNYKKSKMNREQFVDYVHENFNVSVEFLRLLDNVLQYAELQNFDIDDLHLFLNFMLDCGIGISKTEIDMVNIFKEEV